jgi:hypothetical protein
MKKEQKKAFELWYEKNKDTPFHFMFTSIDYCVNDVKLLRKGVTMFKNIIKQVTEKRDPDSGAVIERGINPFLQATTCASLTMFIYRNRFLPEQKIAIIDNDYQQKGNHSKKALLWIIHAT